MDKKSTENGILKVVLADENRLFMDSLKAVIESRKLCLKVVDTAQNGSDAIKKAGKEQPDIILLDINLPGMDGLEVIKSIRIKAPDTKIIILTTNTEQFLIEESLKNEVAGYLLKDIALTQLMTLLPLVNTKTVTLSRELVPILIEHVNNFLNDSDTEENIISSQAIFSGHEKKLFNLIEQGFSNREISEKMHLAEQTVKNYISGIYAKLGVRNRSQAIQKGVNISKNLN